MNLRDLEYFKYLAESLSFTKTAEHFFVSQPSISIALKRLEETFETKLIMRERSARNIYLTSAGKLLYQRSNELLSLFTQTKEDLKAIMTENTQLGLTSETQHTILLPLLEQSNEYHHNLEFIHEQNIDNLLNALRHHQYSSALFPHIEPKIKKKWLDATLLQELPLKIWVSTRHPLAEKKFVTVEDIKPYSFISYPKGSIHEVLFHEWSIKNKLPLDKVFYSEDPNIISTLISNDSRIALMANPKYLLRPDIISISLIDAPHYYISLVANNEMDISPAQITLNNLIIQSSLN